MRSAKHILVIRFGSMGDVVQTTPTLLALRKFAPKARIAYLIKNAFAPLIQNHPGVDEILPLKAKKDAALRRELKTRHFDLVVDLHANLRSRWMTMAVNAPVVRIQNYAADRRRRVWFGNSGPPPPSVAQRGLHALASMGDSSVHDVLPRLYPSLESKRRIALVMKKMGIKGKAIALCPGSAWQTKRWPLKKVAETVRVLAQKGFKEFVLVGDAQDAAAGETLALTLPRGLHWANLAGQVSMEDLAALLQSCSAALCNDSGPMHVATAVGTPVVAVFGPTVEAFGFFPRGPKDQVIRLDLDCQPCHVHGLKACPLGHHQCMEGLDPVRVAQALEKALKKG